ncbi:AMP-dependent synthetase/ligase [Mycobacteroides chelonae]|uniref:AMP-dependent synthetase/ligase n=1 Tax=Mycobacteroides chelonae TaxID=1774 RepID=UPI00399B7F0E
MTTLCAAFQKTAAACGDRVALRAPDGSVELTWRAYRDRVRTIAAGLAALGVGPGDTVALMLVNRPEFHLADVAALHLGATPFSIYNTFAAEQITAVCANAGARVVVTESQFLPLLRASRPGTALEHIVLVDGISDQAISLESVEADGDPDFDLESRWRAVLPGDLATIVYTSGTTGPPKGVEITHHGLLTLLASFVSVLDVSIGPGDRTVSFLPAAHLAERFGVHYLQMVHGIQITTCPDAKKLVTVLKQVRPTYFGAVPRVWEKIKAAIDAEVFARSPLVKFLFEGALRLSVDKVRVRQSGGDISSTKRLLLVAADRLLFARVRRQVGLDGHRVGFLGGVRTQPEVLEFFAAIGVKLTEVYGMTETSGFITANLPGHSRVGTVGRAVPGVELAVADDGELLVRGECLMRGYHNEPDKTREAISADGWLRTGDVAEIDGDGCVRIVDRKKELIINAAGKNMSPLNIESALKAASPLITHAVAIGDGRPYNVALLVIDPEAQAAQALRTGSEDMYVAVNDAVNEANTHLARVEQIKRFAIVEADWQPGSDELTPKGTLKRKPIAIKYADEIHALYDSEGAVQ